MSFFERAGVRDLVYAANPRLVPTRLILVNYWLYHRQVFYFAAGNLFLTGDNGSGKSTALTAAITMLLDGDSSPSRMDPFGGGRRSVRYYLLGDREAGFEFEHRRAYVALEFQHPDGGFVTVGLGLQASTGSREIGKWGFMIPDRVEFEDGLELVGASGEPRSKSELRKSLEKYHGRLTEGTDEYARMVRNSLYPDSSDEEFVKLVELLLTLRGAKLGREVKPSQIEALLRHSLPRVASNVLEQLREGIEGMDRHQARLEVLDAQVGAASRIATAHFEAALARAQHAWAGLRAASNALERAQTERSELEAQLNVLRASIELNAGLETERLSEQSVLELERESLESQLRDADGALREAETRLEEARVELKRSQDRVRGARERLARDEARGLELAGLRESLELERTGFETQLKSYSWLTDDSSLGARAESLEGAGRAWTQFERDSERLQDAETRAQLTSIRVTSARERLEEATTLLEEIMRDTSQELSDRAAALLELPESVRRDYHLTLEAMLDPSDALGVIEDVATERSGGLREAFDTARAERRELQSQLELERENLQTLEAAQEAVPPLPADRAKASEVLTAVGISHAALYEWIQPHKKAKGDLAGLEAGLLASGALTALVVDESERARAIDVLQAAKLEDALLRLPNSEAAKSNLSKLLEPELNAPELVTRWLQAVALEDAQATAGVSADGSWTNGILSGTSSVGNGLRFIGVVARTRERERQLEVLRTNISGHETKLERAEELEQEATANLESFEREWQKLRDARDERRARTNSENDRKQCSSRFDDRTREQSESLETLEAARENSQVALRTLEVSLKPLGLRAERAAFEAAQLEQREAQRTQDSLERTQTRLEAVLGDLERLREELEQRQLEITELDGKRLEWEQRRDTLTVRVTEMRAQLENPDIQAWRDRLRRVQGRLAELRRELATLTQDLARSRGQLEAAQSRQPRVLEEVMRCEERQTRAQEKLARAIATHQRLVETDLASTDNLDSLETNASRLEGALSQTYSECKNALETPESFMPSFDGLTPRFTLDGQPVSSDALTAHLLTELEGAQRLLSEEEARVFHDELVQALAEELDKKIREAREFVRAVRATLSDLRFHDEQLDLELERVATGGLSDLIDGRVTPNFQPASWLERVGQTVRDLVRRLREQPDPERSFPQMLEAALDYREWYGFKFFSQIQDRRFEITDRKFQSRSGGERSAVLYTFMFAALGARFNAMGATGPRLIGLDEAFAGMDPHNIGALYQIMQSLELSLIATSPSEIYLSRSLEVASAYQLFRVSSEDGDGVSNIARLWNGARAIEMGAG